MKLPEGVSESEFLTATKNVARRLSIRWKFPARTEEDVQQDVAVFALECVAKFTPGRGSLENFIYRAARNSLSNLYRGTVRRWDSPCETCKMGYGCGPDGKQCELHRRWEDLQQRRVSLAAPKTNEPTADNDFNLLVENTTASDLEVSELMEFLDERLGQKERRLLLTMRAGEKVTKAEQLLVERAVRAILEEVGVGPEDLGIG